MVRTSLPALIVPWPRTNVPPCGSGPAAWATGTHHGASASDTHTASGSARKRGFRKTRLERRAKRVVRAGERMDEEPLLSTDGRWTDGSHEIRDMIPS